ncbi:MAG: hypothetical protein ACREVL_12140 [Solimonas sp.]
MNMKIGGIDHGSPADGGDEDARLRALLRDDFAQAAHLDDDGFSARVLRALPPPRLPWLEALSAFAVLLALAAGLAPHAADLAPQLAGQVTALLNGVGLSWVGPGSVLLPLLGLGLAGVVLADD